MSDPYLDLSAENRLKAINVLADELLERQDWESVDEVNEYFMNIKELCKI